VKLTKNAVAAGVATACVWLGNDASAASTTVQIQASVAAACSIPGVSAASVDLGSVDPTAATTKTGTVQVFYKCTKGTTPLVAPASGATMTITDGTDTIPVTVARTAAVVGSGTGSAAANTKTITVTVTLAEADAANVGPGSYSGDLVVDISP
jgi:hypothetical protein